MNLYRYIQKNYQFAFMLILWSISGIYASPTHLAIIPVSLILLKKRKMYIEMICGLFYILILSDSWSPSMAWAGNVKDIYMLLLSLFFFFDQKEFPVRNKLYFAFIPYFALAAVLTLRNPEPMDSFLKLLSYVLVFTVLPNFYTKLLSDGYEQFLKMLVYTFTCMLLYGFMLIFINYDTAYLVGRYRGIMGNPNGLGIFCTVFFALFTIITGKFKTLFSKNEAILIYGVILLSVFLSGSRNTTLSILIFFAFSRFFKVSYWLGFTLIIIIGITYQIVISNLPAIISALGLQSYMRVEHLEDGAGRIAAWIFGWQKIQENFLIGKGFNYEGWLYKEYADYLYTLGHIGNSHNSYLAIWLNTGLIGLLLFLTGLIYRFVRAAAHSPYSLPLMYCVIFSATFEAWFVGSLNPDTPLLLLMWTLMEFVFKEKTEPEEVIFDRYKIPTLAT